MPNGAESWVFGVPEETKKALGSASRISGPLKERIVDAIKNCGYPFRTSKLKKQARLLYAGDRTFSEEELFNIIDALTDLLDVPRELRTDLISYSLRGVEGVSAENIDRLVRDVEADPSFAEQKRVSRFMELALPRLKNFEHVCAIRARFSKGFRYAEDSIEDYKPEVSDYHPVVVVRLELSDKRGDTVLQLDQYRLDSMIARLMAAQKELKVLTDAWEKSAGGAK